MEKLIINNIIEKVSSLTKTPKNEFKPDTELYNSTVISSLNLLELMSFIEQQYNIVIRPEELIEDNFKDIKTLSEFIEKKLSG